MSSLDKRNKSSKGKKRNLKKSWWRDNWKSVAIAILVIGGFSLILMAGMWIGYTSGA